MKRLNELESKIKANDKKIDDANKSNYALVDEYHNEILKEILKKNLFKPMEWWVYPSTTTSYPMIDKIYGAKNDAWKPIEKMIERSRKLSWATNTVSLTDKVIIDIEGASVCLLPRIRDTDTQRGKKPDYVAVPDRKNCNYERFMNQGLFEFVKKYELKIKFNHLEDRLAIMKESVRVVEEAVEFFKELNKA